MAEWINRWPGERPAFQFDEGGLPGLAIMRLRQGTPKNYDTLSNLVDEVPATLEDVIPLIRGNFDRLTGGLKTGQVQDILEGRGYARQKTKKAMLDLLRSILERRATGHQQSSYIRE